MKCPGNISSQSQPHVQRCIQSVVGKESGPGAPDEGSRVATWGKDADAKAGPVRQGAQEGLSCCFGRWQEVGGGDSPTLAPEAPLPSLPTWVPHSAPHCILPWPTCAPHTPRCFPPRCLTPSLPACLRPSPVRPSCRDLPAPGAPSCFPAGDWPSWTCASPGKLWSPEVPEITVSSGKE